MWLSEIVVYGVVSMPAGHCFTFSDRMLNVKLAMVRPDVIAALAQIAMCCQEVPGADAKAAICNRPA